MEVRTSMGIPKKTKVKVSVVISVWNSAKTIERCLTSILHQSFSDFEILVIDGNSTDETKKIIDEIRKKSPKVRYFHEEFPSKAASFNRGIMESEAELIMITNADCEVPRDWISRMMKPLTAGEDIVQGGKNLASKGFWSRMQQKSDERFVADNSSDNYSFNIDMENIAFRRSVLLDVGLFNRHIRNLENFDMRLRLIKYGYRIYLLEDIRVIHHQKSNFIELLKKMSRMGKWTYFIYWMNRDGIRTNEKKLFKSLGLSSFPFLIPRTLLILIRHGISAFIYELISGTAWSIGVLSGFIRKERFLKSIKANYY